MPYKIMHKTKPHTLLAICDTEESAQRWIDRFNPKMWDDKTMVKEDLVAVPFTCGGK